MLREIPRPRWVREAPWAPWAAVASVCIGAFMGQLDASIVTIAYPALRSELDSSYGAVEWVSLSYLVVLAVLLVPLGRAGDARGRKLLYVWGFAVFAAASAGCALAPSLAWLLAARAVQGAGAALLQANSVALVALSAPPQQRRSALAVQAGAQALGLALGPVVGGALVQTVGWRWVFGVNVPIGAVAIVAGQLLLPRTRERAERARADLPGGVLLGLASVALLLALSSVSGLDWPAPVAVALLAVAVVAAAFLVPVERRRVAPLIPLGVLSAPGAGFGLVTAAAGYLLLFAPLALYPVVITGRAGGAGIVGLVLAALPVGFAVGALLLTAGPGSRLAWSDTGRVRAGAVVAAAALAGLAGAGSRLAVLVPLLLLLGAAIGVLAPANNALVMAAAPPRDSAVTGGLISVTRAWGTALAVALPVLAAHHLSPRSAEVAVALPLAALAVTIGVLAPASHRGDRRHRGVRK